MANLTRDWGIVLLTVLVSVFGGTLCYQFTPEPVATVGQIWRCVPSRMEAADRAALRGEDNPPECSRCHRYRPGTTGDDIYRYARTLAVYRTLRFGVPDSVALQRNQSAQYIQALVLRSDGSLLENGTTNVSITADNTTVAGGTASFPAGSKVWVFAPTAAQTNGSRITYTFENTNSSAIPTSIAFDTDLPPMMLLANQTVQTAGTVTNGVSLATNQTIASVTTVTGNVNGSVVGNLGGNVNGSVVGNLGGNVNGSVATVGAVTLAANQTIQSVGAVNGTVNVGQINGTTISYLPPTAAEINAEVVDVLNVDTFAEPGQATPGATSSLVSKIGYLFKSWRNRMTQTASEFKLYNDNGTTVDQKATFSDNGTTADRGEITSGP